MKWRVDGYRAPVRSMSIQCPGSVDVRLEEVTCPKCGSKLELFTDEYKTTCRKCGTVVFRDLAACIDWCPHARRCLEERRRHKETETDTLEKRA